MQLYIFNPENDLALADGGAAYCPPPHAARIAYDLASLPLWFAGSGAVVLPDMLHAQFRSGLSGMFSLAPAFENSMMPGVISCHPWGWSPQIRRRLKAMGVDESILPSDETVASVRNLSNRQSSIDILSALKGKGIDIPPMPLYLTSPDDVAAFIGSMPRSVIKAPWSGSGKGIAWGIGRVEVPVENFYKGVIKRQGGVVCEHFLDSVQEFAMEFLVGGNGVQFAGYSLFDAVRGSYSGNVLATDERIEDVLSQYLPLGHIRKVRRLLTELLAVRLAGSGYNGYIGVDMMIYRDGDAIRLNPCMELNVRMNMGVVSRIFHDRYVAPGKEGRFSVIYYKNNGEALAEHIALMQEKPLVVEGGRVVSGYISLSPVTSESRYVARVVIEK